MEIIISIVGASTAILIAIVGAILSHRHNKDLQIAKLKEEHYVSYIAALHNLASNNRDIPHLREYTYRRDKLLIVGSERVVKAILLYEEKAVGKASDLHDKYLTELIKEIRKDLKIRDKNFPSVSLKKN